MKKTWFYVFAAVFFYAFLEVACAATLLVHKKLCPIENSFIRTFLLNASSTKGIQKVIAGEQGYIGLDPVLGWNIQPNGAGGDLYRANSIGIRSESEFSPEAPADKMRIGLFGDSFTHGSDVAYADTWAHFIEAREATFEVMNFGVGGYGLDQAYLRYMKEGRAYHPKVVVIGFMSENIHRQVNNFRPFYIQAGGFVFSKPRFQLKEGGLQLMEAPFKEPQDFQPLLEHPAGVLQEIGRNDYYYQRYHQFAVHTPLMGVVKLAMKMIADASPGELPILRGGLYNRESEAYQITLKLLETFHDQVVRDGSKPLIVVFPEVIDFKNRARRRPSSYAPLVEELRGKGYDVVDAMEGFKKEDERLQDIFGSGWHYNGPSNRLVGKLILERLKK